MKTQWSKIQQFYWRHFASEWQRANHSLRQVERSYSRLIAEAEKKPESHDEVESLYAGWNHDRELQQVEVDRLLTGYWLRRAARHHLPQPDRITDRYWTRDEFLRVSCLTDAGIDFIDRALYEKRKRRWEIWIPLISALTGITGAATGLAAVLLNHR